MLRELYCLLACWPALWCYQCQTPEGYVDWWAVLKIPNTQELVHVNSHTDHIHELGHLWDEDSPLRVTMESTSLDSSATDYLTYATDWANKVINGVSVQHITKGLFVYEVGLVRSGGFWIIHNSSMFPPDIDGMVVTNTSDPIWDSVLLDSPGQQGDSYFLCLSISGDNHLTQLVDHWLLSNPSVFREKLRNQFWDEKLKKSSYPRSTLLYTAAGEASGECFSSTYFDLKENCFHEYVDPDAGLYLATKTRGMSKHAAQICANFIAGPSEEDFVEWDIQFKPADTTTSGSPRGIRAITLSHVCFGSDVTQTGDLSLAMACINHPRLAQWLFALKLKADWSCKTALLSRFKSGDGQNAYLGNASNSVPKPTQKTPKQRQTVKDIDRREDLENVLYENSNALLAIFYRKGCRYCDATGKAIDSLSKTLWESYDVDVVMIDVMVLGLPVRLYPKWVPTIMYREPVGELTTSGDSLGNWVTQTKLSFDPKEVFTFINFNQRNLKISKRNGRKKEQCKEKQNNITNNEEIKRRGKRDIDSASSDGDLAPPEEKRRKLIEDVDADKQERKQKHQQQTKKKEKKRKQEQPSPIAEQCPTDKLYPDDCSEILKDYHNKEETLYRCVGVGNNNIDEEKAVQLSVLNKCAPKDRNFCPKDDAGKRKMFLGLGEGCTILKGRLVKICQKKLTELHKVTCINGNPYKRVLVSFKLNKKRRFHAEGHLRLYLEEQLNWNSLKESIQHDCEVEMWVTLNYNPCHDVCSGAKRESLRNVPEMKEMIEKKLGRKVALRVAFAKLYEEGDDKIKGSLQFLSTMSDTSVYLCHYPQEWWKEYNHADKNTIKEDWEQHFSNVSSRIEEWNVKIGRKPSCIYPTDEEHPEFIEPTWQPELHP